MKFIQLRDIILPIENIRYVRKIKFNDENFSILIKYDEDEFYHIHFQEKEDDRDDEFDYIYSCLPS